MVPAVARPSGSATLEDRLIAEVSAYDTMGLEKSDRQERNVLQTLHRPGRNTQEICIRPIEGILAVLIPEGLQRPPGETGNVKFPRTYVKIIIHNKVIRSGSVIFGKYKVTLMRRTLFALAFIFTTVSCGKDTFKSQPQLSLKSVSSTKVPAFGNLQVILRLTDREGDFQDTVWVKKVTTRCPSSNFADSLLYRIPKDLPRTSNFDGDVVLSFTYPFELQPRCTRPDTAVFSFWMKDKKGNRSDTVKTPQIIILRP
jgi:hypothetical protein